MSASRSKTAPVSKSREVAEVPEADTGSQSMALSKPIVPLAIQSGSRFSSPGGNRL
jgi:hypothetical protein